MEISETERAVGLLVAQFQKRYRDKWTTPKCAPEFNERKVREAFLVTHKHIEKRLSDLDRRLRANARPVPFRLKCQARMRVWLWKEAVRDTQ